MPQAGPKPGQKQEENVNPLVLLAGFVVGVVVGAVVTDAVLGVLVKKTLARGVLTQETLSDVSEGSVWERFRAWRRS